jgi:DNA polymerase II small subunit/DNA polymerase delta subunit B
MEVICDICQKTFKNKYILTQHKKKSKSCLELQGSSSQIECEFCLKKICTNERLLSHLSICKEKKKNEIEKIKQEYEEKIKNLEEKYEEKLKNLEEKYEEKLEKEREVIRQMAMKPTTTHTSNKNTTINNMNTLNFNDKERLNRVIRNNMTEKVVEQGQAGFAVIVYNKYLKDENGNQLYVLKDGARQHFQFIDPEGNIVTDMGAKILTDAIAASNLERETANIAKDIKGLYENKDKFEKVMSLTGEFKNDNSTFRKEIVHLAKKDQKVKKKK